MSLEEYTHQFMELARYEPEEVNDDEKKQDMFKKRIEPRTPDLAYPSDLPGLQYADEHGHSHRKGQS